MKPGFELKRGDVVQLNPELHSAYKGKRLAGLFLVVNESDAGGVRGYVLVPGKGDKAWPTPEGIRVTWEEIEYVGKSVWTLD